MGYAIDHDHGLPAGQIIGASEIDKGAFGHELVRDAPLQHKFGLGGHADAVRAGSERGRRERLGDGQLVHTGRRRHGRGQQHVRR